MKGRVVLVNRDLGWFAVQHANHDVTVIDGLGDPLPRVNDVIEGNLHSTTREMLSNRTSSDALIVRVMGTGPNLAYATALMEQGTAHVPKVPVVLHVAEPIPTPRAQLAANPV
jgi:hypothetical protein